MSDLSTLSLQAVELLPAREALQGYNTVSNIITNVATAIPDYWGDADADADQTVVLIQEVG